ncbi:hypothetical protein BJ742DRAFT_837665 [Cladochytrium replicatum]|nr:hypothetical protein BJ742DRAFT_837665 [Cladochytrium replicatum]
MSNNEDFEGGDVRGELEEEENAAVAVAEEAPKSKNKRYRKDKPWDTDDIDKWKIEPFKQEEAPGELLDESSFATLFPKYRENYLREVWQHVVSALDKVGIDAKLNLVEGSMTVMTTKKTYDPYIIFKARDLIKLLSRSVPLAQALRVLEDGGACDIIKIGNILRNKERFVKRRQRLIGPNGNTLKAIELLTSCYVMVQGNTVSALGPYKGLKEVRRIVVDCMKNIHPIYHIKELMIKRELAKDEKLKNESWDRFLPHFKKQNNKKAKKSKKEKKESSLFPAPPQPRKIDLQIESGEYFLSDKKKAAIQMKKKMEAQEENTAKRKQERQAAFIAPKEDHVQKKMKANDESAGAISTKPDSIEELKKKYAEAGKRKRGIDAAGVGAGAGEDVGWVVDGKKKKAKTAQ